MQCNFLRWISETSKEYKNECMCGPARYITSENDRNTYCLGENFDKCPRLRLLKYIEKKD
jgi:hypothetical protein